MPEKTEIQLGGTKRFECRVIGYPRPDIKWYKDGVDITQNSRFNFAHTREGVISMLIEKVSRQDEGCYRCRAQNSEGMASTAAYLFVRRITDVESGLSNEELRMAMSERSDTDVSTESTTRRYIKLVGAAAAFTLVAFGVHKMVQGFPKGS